jgi:hypothetical protein
MKLVGVYTAPGATHWLNITAVHGGAVTLMSDTGATLTFDLTTHTFND